MSPFSGVFCGPSLKNLAWYTVWSYTSYNFYPSLTTYRKGLCTCPIIYEVEGSWYWLSLSSIQNFYIFFQWYLILSVCLWRISPLFGGMFESVTTMTPLPIIPEITKKPRTKYCRCPFSVPFILSWCKMNQNTNAYSENAGHIAAP